MKQSEKDILYWSKMLNETNTQTNVICERRMSGPAAARNGGVDEIAQMRAQLASGIVEFEFTKADGTLRHAVGTTSEQVIPVAERRRLDPTYDENMASYERRSGYIIWFWDLEKNGLRCFNTNKFERTINVEPVNHPVNNVERVGNIFIHRDVDQGVNLTPDVIAEVNDDLTSTFGEGSDNADWNDAVPGAIVIGQLAEVGIARNNQGEPVLQIQFAKRGRPDDPPYQICVNEIRRYIQNQYGITVNDIRVTGRFEY